MWPFSSNKNELKIELNRTQTFVRQLPSLRLSFSVPKTNVANIDLQEPHLELDKLSSEVFNPQTLKGKVLDGQLIRPLFAGGWTLGGASLFGSPVGHVGCSINLIKTDLLGVNESFFDSDCLLDTVANIQEMESETQVFEVPGEDQFDFSDLKAVRMVTSANAQWCRLAGLPCYYFEAFETVENRHFCHFVLPVEDSTLLFFSFQFWRYTKGAGNYYRASEKQPIDAFRQMMTELLEGLEFEPSADLKKAYDALSEQLTISARRLVPDEKYVFLSKWAMQKASSVEYRIGEVGDKSITPHQASAFVDNLLKPTAIPGSYGFDGPVTYVHHQGDLSPVPLSFRKEVPPPA